MRAVARSRCGEAHERKPAARAKQARGQSMNYRSSIGAAAVAAALLMTSMAAPAFDDAKYPDLSGQWVAVRLGVAGPTGVRPDQALGPGAAGAVDARVSEGPGGQRRRTSQRQPGQLAVRRLLPPDRHAGDDDALSSDGNRGAAGHHLHPDRSHAPIPPQDLHRRARHGRRTSRRASAAIPSANGSIRMATASTTCSRSRPAS